MKMKKYGAIGHFRGSENMVSVVMKASTIKSFRDNLGGNDFIPYVIISENKMDVLKNTYDVFGEVKKMTSNYNKWIEVTQYIEQCFDILEERFLKA